MAGSFLVINGVPISGDEPIPSVSVFLASNSGAYTTTRTSARATALLFWDRHLRRLAASARLLSDHRPHLFYSHVPNTRTPPSLEALRPLVLDSIVAGLRLASRARADDREEVAVTALARGRDGGAVDVIVHLGFYVPPVFGSVGARLAVVGPGRDFPAAKYSDWARVRKRLERMRPPSATELLLSNDGERILEGAVTNFFVVRRNDRNVVNAIADVDSTDSTTGCPYILQTASVSDGVLPGIIRELVIDICLRRGIPVQELPPSWSEHELWEEAFVTSSLRLVQHVEVIQAPSSHVDFGTKSWGEVAWVVKRFEV